MFCCIDRPTNAILRPFAIAACATCCTRCKCEAKLVTMNRLSAYSRKSERIAAPTVDSDGVKPGRSALVESDMRRRTPPSRLAMSPSIARLVRRPSTGVRSSLKSPLWMIVPTGVKNAIAKPSGTECVTGMNWQSTGPIRRRSPSMTGNQLGPVEHARFLDAVAGHRERKRRAVHRDRDVAEEERDPARVVLVGVGQQDRLDPVGVLAQVGEVGKHQIDAGHVGVGEHDPAVDEQDSLVDLDATTVAPDLAQPAQKDDADRVTHCAVTVSPAPCGGGRSTPAVSGYPPVPNRVADTTTVHL